MKNLITTSIVLFISVVSYTQDTTLNIKWESEPDLIDVSEDIVDIPSDNKD